MHTITLPDGTKVPVRPLGDTSVPTSPPGDAGAMAMLQALDDKVDRMARDVKVTMSASINAERAASKE